MPRFSRALVLIPHHPMALYPTPKGPNSAVMSRLCSSPKNGRLSSKMYDRGLLWLAREYTLDCSRLLHSKLSNMLIAFLLLCLTVLVVFVFVLFPVMISDTLDLVLSVASRSAMFTTPHDHALDISHHCAYVHTILYDSDLPLTFRRDMTSSPNSRSRKGGRMDSLDVKGKHEAAGRRRC